MGLDDLLDRCARIELAGCHGMDGWMGSFNQREEGGLLSSGSSGGGGGGGGGVDGLLCFLFLGSSQSVKSALPSVCVLDWTVSGLMLPPPPPPHQNNPQTTNHMPAKSNNQQTPCGRKKRLTFLLLTNYSPLPSYYSLFK